MKELTVQDLRFAFEHDIKMALYTLERYSIDANFGLLACEDYDFDKAQLMDTVRQSDIIKKVNEHYIAVLFTFVDHFGARTALEKLLNRYRQFELKGSLIVLKKGDTIEEVFERMLQANHIIHHDIQKNLFAEFEYEILR